MVTFWWIFEWTTGKKPVRARSEKFESTFQRAIVSEDLSSQFILGHDRSKKQK